MLRDAEIEASCNVGAEIAALFGLVAMVISASACVDHTCPKGYRQEGDRCYRMKDAGAGDGSVELEMDAELATSGNGSGDDAEQEPEDVEDAHDAGKPETGAIDSGTCTGSDCPECDDRNPCTAEHELCVGNKCVVQPYCGDGKKGADEECDPMHPSWDAWSCDSSCKGTTAYLPCSGAENEPLGGCAPGERCLNGQCMPGCNVPGDCPAAPAESAVTVSCIVDVFGGCLLGCKAASDCPPGLVCVHNSSPLVQMNICAPCTLGTACPPGQECKFRSGSDKFRRCM